MLLLLYFIVFVSNNKFTSDPPQESFSTGQGVWKENILLKWFNMKGQNFKTSRRMWTALFFLNGKAGQ